MPPAAHLRRTTGLRRGTPLALWWAMGKQNQEEKVTELDLEDLLEVVDGQDEITQPNLLPVEPPPPPRGEFEGWPEGEEDLT
jgi:hypothetical protein